MRLDAGTPRLYHRRRDYFSFGCRLQMRLLVPITMILGACGGSDKTEIVIGMIELAGEQARISVPESAVIGTPLRVGIDTFGDGCYRFESTDVELDDSSVVITPFDEIYLDSCTLGVIRMDHSTDVTFTTPGTKEVIIRGRIHDNRTDEVVERVFFVTIEP